MNRVTTVLYTYCISLLILFSESSAQVAVGLVGDKIDVDINGNFSVLDLHKNTLALFAKGYSRIAEIGGSGWEADQFDRPAGVWARNGIDVFVADYGNHRIQRFDRGLHYVSTLFTRENPNPEERFGYPSDVTLSRLGYLFICDTENSRIVKVNRFSQVERSFGGFDAGEGRLYTPTQVECGPKDEVYVVDGSRLVVFDNFGNFMHSIVGLFRQPVTLYADEEKVVVVDSMMAYCFDNEGRAVYSLPLGTLLDRDGIHVTSLAFSKDSMFVMTTGGLRSVIDPRQLANQR